MHFFFNFDAPLINKGEALTVIDANEAWMFHIIPDPTQSSAIWVAQRVPDDHVSNLLLQTALL